MGGIKAELDILVSKHDLPMEAFAGSCDAFDISEHWLRRAKESEQVAAIIVWFKERYFVPNTEIQKQKAFAESGPISVRPVIVQRFGHCASLGAVESAIEKLHLKGNQQWALVEILSQRTYDENFAIYVPRFSAPAQKTLDRLAEIKSLEFSGDDFDFDRDRLLIRNLAFGAAITALESFLWETMVYWVENDEKVVRRIITTHPAFKDQLIKLSTIFEKQDVLRTDILGFMQGVVWHNWDKVSALYKYGLGLERLSLDKFTPAVLIRHDIVHRSGFTKTGEKVEVTTHEIRELCREISAFAMQTSARIEEKYVDKIDDVDLPF